MARINIKSGNGFISIESDDAGVPDVTEGTGPDIIELQDDAMAEPGEENSEFDASIDDSEVEEEDKMEAVEKANESFFDGIFGLEDGEVAAITDDGDGATSDTDEVVTSEEPDGDSDDGEGAGEVSEGDGTTTVDTGDVVITITNSDEDESDDDDDGVSESDNDVEENDDGEDDEPVVGEENADPDEMDNDQAIESFFQNLGL